MRDRPSAAAAEFSGWLGCEQSQQDLIDLRTARALAATLDIAPEAVVTGAPLPPLWHWVYFTPTARASELGPDGHPRRGGFLPPVELPNRMWAGGRFVFGEPLRIGETATRASRVIRCERKHGRGGELVFVTVEHTIAGARGTALVEEHDIVYRQPSPRGAPPAGEPARVEAEFRQRVRPDAVLLFRYSALTFNGHRIHYDRPYVTGVEGYPGLVVHGPLVATLLLECFRAAHPGCVVHRFDYRAVGPLFDNADVELCGRLDGPGAAQLWTDCGGRVTMRASVGFDR